MTQSEWLHLSPGNVIKFTHFTYPGVGAICIVLGTVIKWWNTRLVYEAAVVYVEDDVGGIWPGIVGTNLEISEPDFWEIIES